MRRERLIYLALLLITAAVFWPVVHCQFINLDDATHVTANGAVRQGLTPDTVRWAFRTTVSANWHPLTWLSHMLDCQLFGLNAGAHHLVNVMFHAANTLLLFHLLRRLTRELWPSALTAALFALHPLHVESVAWISERKDVLSTLFGLLTIWAYGRYTQCGTHERKRKVQHYLLAIVFLALGLMSKPMLVTWPFVLLLLDFWPLGRMSNFQPQAAGASTPDAAGGVGLRRLVLEKLPFLALSIVSSAITVFAQRAGGAMPSSGQLSFSMSVDNALVSYVRYLAKAVWPQHLAALYPHPGEWPEWEMIGSVLILALITLGAWWQRGRRPYLVFGWLWFVGTLVPVIGLVQVGAQAIADRYMYVPSIGLFVMMVWGVKDFLGPWPVAQRSVGMAGAAAVLLGCLLLTGKQLRYWHDSETLFRRALEVTTNNMPAECLLGDALIKQRKVDEGLEHLAQALRLNPTCVQAHIEMADILSRRGKFRESIYHYREILRYEPDTATVLNNLAWMLATNPNAEIRDGPEAVRLAQRACELTHYRITMFVGTLAAAYAEAGRYQDAIQTGEKARALAPAFGEKELAKKNEELLKLYREGRPCREVPAGPVSSTPAEPAPL